MDFSICLQRSARFFIRRFSDIPTLEEVLSRGVTSKRVDTLEWSSVGR